jgi:hypothetical protein
MYGLMRLAEPAERCLAAPVAAPVLVD